MHELDKITNQYNPDFDVIRSGPNVTWAEMALASACKKLLDRIEKLEAKIEALEGGK